MMSHLHQCCTAQKLTAGGRGCNRMLHHVVKRQWGEADAKTSEQLPVCLFSNRDELANS